MGDRATIHFGTSPDAIDAAIYLHWAGDVMEQLNAFFDDEADRVKIGGRHTRFDDPGRLAALFVAWHEAMRGHEGMSIVPPRSMDGVDYLVTCVGDTVPTVTRLDN